jgi:hypothetical protein
MKLLYGGRLARFDKGFLDNDNDIKHDFTNARDYGKYRSHFLQEEISTCILFENAVNVKLCLQAIPDSHN